MSGGRWMRGAVAAVIAIAAIGLGGCYHAVITTGRTPSATVVEKQWAHSFLWGLVPPSPIDVSSQCADGVAKVETQHSFLNELATWVTWGIYSPMMITVTCAGSGGDDDADAIDVQENASPEQVSEAWQQAIERSARTGAAAYVRFAEAQ